MKYHNSIFVNKTTIKNHREHSNPIRVVCECGHVINFLYKKEIVCKYCGRVVYPDKKYEFKCKFNNTLKRAMKGN